MHGGMNLLSGLRNFDLMRQSQLYILVLYMFCRKKKHLSILLEQFHSQHTQYQYAKVAEKLGWGTNLPSPVTVNSNIINQKNAGHCKPHANKSKSCNNFSMWPIKKTTARASEPSTSKLNESTTALNKANQPPQSTSTHMNLQPASSVQYVYLL